MSVRGQFVWPKDKQFTEESLGELSNTTVDKLLQVLQLLTGLPIDPPTEPIIDQSTNPAVNISAGDIRMTKLENIKDLAVNKLNIPNTTDFDDPTKQTKAKLFWGQIARHDNWSQIANLDYSTIENLKVYRVKLLNKKTSINVKTLWELLRNTLKIDGIYDFNNIDIEYRDEFDAKKIVSRPSQAYTLSNGMLVQRCRSTPLFYPVTDLESSGRKQSNTLYFISNQITIRMLGRDNGKQFLFSRGAQVSNAIMRDGSDDRYTTLGDYYYDPYIKSQAERSIFGAEMYAGPVKWEPPAKAITQNVPVTREKNPTEVVKALQHNSMQNIVGVAMQTIQKGHQGDLMLHDGV